MGVIATKTVGMLYIYLGSTYTVALHLACQDRRYALHKTKQTTTVPMSQKVNPNSFRSQLQSLAYLGAPGTQDTGVASFSSPHKMK